MGVGRGGEQVWSRSNGIKEEEEKELQEAESTWSDVTFGQRDKRSKLKKKKSLIRMRR